MKAVRNGITAVFSDRDWKTGQPQRYGWREEGKEGKTLPKEIVDFIERRKAPEVKQDKPQMATGGIVPETKIETTGGETVIPSPPSQVRKIIEKDLNANFAAAGAKAGQRKTKPVKQKVEPIVVETMTGDIITITENKVTKKTYKSKSNDNPKQKGRTPGKHNPGRVAKA